MRDIKNKNLIFLLIFFLFLSINHKVLSSSEIKLKRIEMNLLGKVGEGILNFPGSQMMGYNISAIDDDYFYLYDSKGNFPFYAIDKKSLKMKGFGKWGQGPGELGRGSFIYLSSGKSDIFVFIPFLNKILIFDKKNLEFKREVRVTNIETGSSIYMIENKDLIYMSFFSEKDNSLMRRGIMEEDGKVDFLPIYYGEYKKFPKIKTLKDNPMLKRGPIHIDREGNIYFAHYYSSLRMGFSPKGDKIFFDFSPRNIEIPKAEIKNAGGVITGDPERCIQSYLSLFSDEKYLYALFSGEEITMEKIIAFKTGKQKELHLGEGKILDVFIKKDGSYLFSFELPFFANSIAVDKNNFYFTSIEDEPSVLIYKKPKF